MDAPTESARPSPSDDGAAPAPVAVRVLVVDDIATNREVAVAVLQASGHRVDAVAGGEEAIRAVRDGGYNVVLMDVEMPDVDGLTATRVIRGLGGEAGRVPVVALTAGVYADQIAVCRAAGMDDHIAKPVNFRELRDKVAVWAARGAFRSGAVPDPHGA